MVYVKRLHKQLCLCITLVIASEDTKYKRAKIFSEIVWLQQCKLMWQRDVRAVFGCIGVMKRGRIHSTEIITFSVVVENVNT